MSSHKERITVTIDRDLLQAGNEAVASGRSASLSTWVNAALSERAAKDRRLRALAEAVADYEAGFGAITADELAAQQRDDRRAGAAASARKKPVRARRSRTA